MTTLHLITLGKLKESYWHEAEAEYTKRLSPWAEVVFHEIKEESFNDKDPSELIKAREADKILEVLEKIKDTFVLVLDGRGRAMNSVQLSTLLTTWREEYHNLTVIIGGPRGLDDSIMAIGKRPGGFLLSLSNLTFTHQMARIFLLEQLYRAMMIAEGRTYHY
jgi:23S rRNA (pseudouridine1915-N3)-methyltransferase